MGKKSRDKGASFERKVSKLLTDWWGLTFRRVPLSGGYDKSLVVGDLWITDERATIEDVKKFPFSIEAKNREEWEWNGIFGYGNKALFSYWKQAKMDAAKQSKIPLLIFKKNLTPIFIMWDTSTGIQSHTLPHSVSINGAEPLMVAKLEDWIKLFSKDIIVSGINKGTIKAITRKKYNA